MKENASKYARIVNYIYILPYAGTPSSPASASALFPRTAQNARKKRGRKHTDRRSQHMCLRISESRQPRQKADRKAAARNRKCSRQPLPGRMLRSQKASEKNRRKADAAGRRRDLLLIDHTAEHESRPQRRQGQKRCAGDGKALQNCSQETSVPEFCFHVFSPPLPKGMFVRTEKEPAEVNWKRPRRFLNIFNRAKRDFSEVSAYLLNFFRISACWPQVIFPSGHLPETKHVGP